MKAEERKQRIEIAKALGYNIAGHPDEGTLIFDHEEFNLIMESYAESIRQEEREKQREDVKECYDAGWKKGCGISRYNNFDDWYDEYLSEKEEK